MLRTLARIPVVVFFAAVEAATFLVAFCLGILAIGLGMVFLFPPMVGMVRPLADRARRQARAWSGIEVAPPYLPEPPPPRPGPDGWYRVDRTLYRTPRYPAWHSRFRWLLRDPATWRDLLWLMLDPLAKLLAVPFLLVLPGPAARAYALWVRLLLGHTTASRLAGRVQHLTQVRSIAVDSQAAEMRRIERDLHDGAQARLVALGMTLGAVEQLVDRDPAAAKALLAKAREASAEALTELRRVVRGIHPPVLAERGLADAVRALAMDSPLRVSVEVDLPHRTEPPVEAAVYFAVSELLSNAARHGGATQALVDISHNGSALRVTVTDDGAGGADPAQGSGLYGIERRLAAFDGVLALHSPPGGPTTVTMEIPGVLPTPWHGMKKMPRWKTALVLGLWATAWCPLFPQGLVAACFKIFNAEHIRSWFLALYLPPAWQWPTIAFMITLGVIMYAFALLLPAAHTDEVERCRFAS
ncbi:sensor histidine kinase [Thermoactinospora rubra]|uniref:sensor histidine kinase n=1 Tax=Thermoactinospora rubra TaxID=1088767 RepID=UPI000A10AEAA|nr:histidine kinase [Thermoactinospora rubra]